MRLPLVAASLAGAVMALGAYTFVYAKGYSYLTNNPGACANCHIMADHHAAWLKSSHRSVAVCNDCHTPPGTVAKHRQSYQRLQSFLCVHDGAFP